MFHSTVDAASNHNELSRPLRTKIEPKDDDPQIFCDDSEFQSEEQPQELAAGSSNNSRRQGVASLQSQNVSPTSCRSIAGATMVSSSTHGERDLTVEDQSTASEFHPADDASSVSSQLDHTETQLPSQADTVTRSDAGFTEAAIPFTQPELDSSVCSPESDLSKSPHSGSNKCTKSTAQFVEQVCGVAPGVEKSSPHRRVKLFCDTPDKSALPREDAEKKRGAIRVSFNVTEGDSHDKTAESTASPDLAFQKQVNDMLASSQDQGSPDSSCIEHILGGNDSPTNGSSTVQREGNGAPLAANGSSQHPSTDAGSAEKDSIAVEISSMVLSVEKSTSEDEQAPLSPKKNTIEVKMNDDWNSVHRKMIESGWTHVKGKERVTNYYLPPGGKLPSAGGRLDEDYVEELFGMKRFAHRHLGWGGDEGFLVELKISQPKNILDGTREFGKQSSTQASPRSLGTEVASLGDRLSTVSPKKAIDKTDDWNTVNRKMNMLGWTYAKGKGLVSEFYVPPGGKLPFAGGRLDEDYVEEIFGKQKYAYNNLGWGGDEAFLKELQIWRSSKKTKRSARGTLKSLSILESSIDDRSGSIGNESRVGSNSSDSPGNDATRKRAAAYTSAPLANNAHMHVPTSQKGGTRLRPGHPESKKTIGEKLRACQEALATSYSVRMLSAVDSDAETNDQTIFQRNLVRLNLFIRAAIDSEGRHGEERGDPACLYLCGAPGVGKSCSVKWTINEAERLASEQQGLHNLPLPSICFVNAADIISPKHISEKIADALSLKGKRRTPEHVKKALDSSQSGKRATTCSCLILIIDEIDLLLSEKGKTSNNPSSAGEEALKMLGEWASSDKFRFTLIGISNCVGNLQAKRLQKFGLVSIQTSFGTNHRNQPVLTKYSLVSGAQYIDILSL